MENSQCVAQETLQESPEYLQTSLAAAMTLGFRKGLFWRNAKMTCINLLLTYKDGCRAACAYCGLGRNRKGGATSFIRVPWFSFRTTEIISHINDSKIPKRICISMVTHPRAVADTIALTRLFKDSISQPISLLISPTITKNEDLLKFKEAGADKIGIAFDIPSPELFDSMRGSGVKGPHKLERYKTLFCEAVKVFGDWNVGSHYMVGLGETEREMAEALQWVHDTRGVNHLFSFFPEGGSPLENHPQPPMAAYRRIQIACHIIDEGIRRSEDFSFSENDGHITGFGISEMQLDEIIESGAPFITRGCTGADGEVACNRPFANSFPGPDLRNYPFKPQADDISLIKSQIKFD